MSDEDGWKEVDVSSWAKVANGHIFGIAIIIIGLGIGMKDGEAHCKEVHTLPEAGQDMTNTDAYQCLARHDGGYNPGNDYSIPTQWVSSDSSIYGKDGDRCDDEFKESMEGEDNDAFCASPGDDDYNPNLCMCKKIVEQRFMGVLFRFGPYGIMLLVLFCALISKCFDEECLPDYNLLNLFVCRGFYWINAFCTFASLFIFIYWLAGGTCSAVCGSKVSIGDSAENTLIIIIVLTCIEIIIRGVIWWRQRDEV